MIINDFVSVTRNKANNQVSFNLKSRTLKQKGITPEQILNLKVPKNDIRRKEVNFKWKKQGMK